VVRSGRNRQGKPVHRFSWRCPVCGSQLPVFLPLKPDEVRKVIAGGIRPDIFYFDRVSRSSLVLAQWYRRHGAVVMFEPQWMRKSRIFAECLQAADILKASREMMKRSFEEIDTDGIPLVIETLGSGGLRYRFSGTGSGAQRWQQVAAFPVTGIADTVGAGDWCSAGLLHALLVGGGFPVREAGGEAVRTALRFGQALAALNCKFPGARGAMDALSRPAFRACAAAICRDGDCTVPALKARVQRPGRLPRVLCPRCSQAP
jgi:fructokinase